MLECNLTSLLPQRWNFNKIIFVTILYIVYWSKLRFLKRIMYVSNFEVCILLWNLLLVFRFSILQISINNTTSNYIMQGQNSHPLMIEEKNAKIRTSLQLLILFDCINEVQPSLVAICMKQHCFKRWYP